MKLRLTLAATSAVLTFSSFAAAQQPWITDDRYGQGAGIRTGNFELHPSLAAEFGYDSNYFQRAETEPPIEDAFRLRVTPALSLSTLTERALVPTPSRPTKTSDAGEPVRLVQRVIRRR